MSTTTELAIEGMTCQHCVKRATNALESVAGVSAVEVTLEPGGATVVGSADSSELIQAVEIPLGGVYDRPSGGDSEPTVAWIVRQPNS